MSEKFVLKATERFYRNLGNAIEVILAEGLVKENDNVAYLLRTVEACQREYAKKVAN